eukprot:743357-Pleurochrysis_carterae.AAC.1
MRACARARLSKLVEERAARVARVDRGVRLDEVHLLVRDPNLRPVRGSKGRSGSRHGAGTGLKPPSNKRGGGSEGERTDEKQREGEGPHEVDRMGEEGARARNSYRVGRGCEASNN